MERVIAKPLADPSTCILSGKGGVIEFFGAENVAHPLLYQEVGHVLEKSWGPSHGMKNLSLFRTSNAGRKGMLDWMPPTLFSRDRRGRARQRLIGLAIPSRLKGQVASTWINF